LKRTAYTCSSASFQDPRQRAWERLSLELCLRIAAQSKLSKTTAACVAAFARLKAIFASAMKGGLSDG
jgi:hypothetical protein